MWLCEHCTALQTCRRQVLAGGPFARQNCETRPPRLWASSHITQVEALLNEAGRPMTTSEVAERALLNTKRAGECLRHLAGAQRIHTAHGPGNTLLYSALPITDDACESPRSLELLSQISEFRRDGVTVGATAVALGVSRATVTKYTALARTRGLL